MEVMEEGNLMDRVPILLQRDLQYYQEHQTVLQESICIGVVGGRLDFPRNASFASVKLVMWWEEEFLAAFRTGSGLLKSNVDEEDSVVGCGGIVKASDPDKFVGMVVKSSELLLEHLHILSQEALDHADLPVLTATLGASALIKNSLHCYIQASQNTGSGERTGSLQKTQKMYGEMAEALAERLLDLHGRLLSLYVLQGVTEEGGSSSVRMWWLYMQGTRQDLWDTVPPKMAQRVFAGMLNETLTILTVRYTQEATDEKRNNILVNDILNILLCVSQLLPAVCAKGEELIGLNITGLGKIIRDVHAKCHELLICLLLRGAPLHCLYKMFKQPSGVHLFESRPGYPSLWYILSMPHLFPSNSSDRTVLASKDLSKSTAIALELYVLLSQPQPLWSLLLKVLLMRNCYVASRLLKKCIKDLPNDLIDLSEDDNDDSISCDGFLCVKDGSCLKDKKVTFTNPSTSNTDGIPMRLIAEVIKAIAFIVVSLCSESDIQCVLIGALESTGTVWAANLDKRQLWVLKRPPWLSSILSLVSPVLPAIAQTLINAIQTGASMYQAMSLCLSCFSQMWDCLPRSLITVSKLISDVLPATSMPVGDSVLLQLLLMALYEELISLSKCAGKEVKVSTEPVASNTKDVKKNILKKDKKKHTKRKEKSISEERMSAAYSLSFDGSLSNISSIALALAEALCSIDEENKHTDQINKLKDQFQKPIENNEDFGLEGIVELMGNCYPNNPVVEYVELSDGAEVMVSQLLMTSMGRSSLQILHQYLLKHSNWLLNELGAADHLPLIGNKTVPVSSVSLIYTMFFIGRRPFDQITKSNVVDDMVASNSVLYKENETPDHCVVIKYVPYVGDSKRAMDEYTSEILMGGHNTIAVHNTCEDSLLATPIILDLVLLTELFSRIYFKEANTEEKMTNFHQVLSPLSYLLKAPLVPENTPVINALFKQRACIENILRACIGLSPENHMMLEDKVPFMMKCKKAMVNGYVKANGTLINGFNDLY